MMYAPTCAADDARTHGYNIYIRHACGPTVNAGREMLLCLTGAKMIDLYDSAERFTVTFPEQSRSEGRPIDWHA